MRAPHPLLLLLIAALFVVVMVRAGALTAVVALGVGLVLGASGLLRRLG